MTRQTGLSLTMGKMTKFEYDSRNRLICAGDVRYRYDAENVRIAADYPEYTEEYVIDRENAPSRTLQIIRTDKNSGADNSETNSGTDKEAGIGYSDSEINYYYGIALIYEKEADKISVYHFDHLGSTRNITDEKGISVIDSDMEPLVSFYLYGMVIILLLLR